MDKMVEEAKYSAETDKQFAQSHASRRALHEFLESLREYPGKDNLKLRDQRKLEAIVSKAEEFMTENAGKASHTDYKAKLREVEADSNPITSLLYEGGDVNGEDDMDFPDDEATRDEM
eukprot:TRINITY_DN13395_c0_g1_i2.p1 TRINITY_DN13395_c0_g1~~TRINITY_DN13395_c0_g1_i2.p1  ORF type:complete len:118 (+),score=30.26 TRINITY_DN13395_c0_g1_i2:128-481(+)